jgi:uncharacterized protein
MRLEIHVRPNASTPAVGGDFDSALIVRVVEAADGGRATEAALKAVAAAIDAPRRSVSLLRGPRNRRKLVEIQVSSMDARRIEKSWIGCVPHPDPDWDSRACELDAQNT